MCSSDLAGFEALARRRGMTPAQMALAWVLAANRDVIAIPGTRSAEHMAENVAAARFALTRADREEIASVFPTGFPWGNRYSDAQLLGVEASD